MSMASKKIIQTITIPKIGDDATLCFGQIDDHIPFTLKRVYYILKPKKNEPRGYHAHFETDQLLFCIQGKVKMILDDGKRKEKIVLDRPNVGVLLPRMMWHEMHDMNKETILLVLASEKFKAEDYIRDYKQFKKITQDK